jgi:hypothetical protein
MFTGWLQGFNRKLKAKFLVGASAMYWVIWLTRNEVVFDRITTSSYLQVIFRGHAEPGPDPYYRRREWPNDEDGMQAD